MIKKVLMILLSLSVLSACSSDLEPIGKFEDMKIVDKKRTEECFKGCTYDFFITLEKSEEKVSLEVPNERMHNAVKKGSTVTVSYDENYMIKELTFKIQSKN